MEKLVVESALNRISAAEIEELDVESVLEDVANYLVTKELSAATSVIAAGEIATTEEQSVNAVEKNVVHDEPLAEEKKEDCLAKDYENDGFQIKPAGEVPTPMPEFSFHRLVVHITFQNNTIDFCMKNSEVLKNHDTDKYWVFGEIGASRTLRVLKGTSSERSRSQFRKRKKLLRVVSSGQVEFVMRLSVETKAGLDKKGRQKVNVTTFAIKNPKVMVDESANDEYFVNGEICREVESAPPIPPITVEEGEVLDRSGLDPNDIELVMVHADVSEQLAIKALLIFEGDIEMAMAHFGLC